MTRSFGRFATPLLGLCVGVAATLAWFEITSRPPQRPNAPDTARLARVCLLADREAETALLSTRRSDREAVKAGNYALIALQGIRQICHESDGVVVQPQVRFEPPSN